MLQKRKGSVGGGGRGGMGLAGLILLGVGTWAVSNSLFNGMGKTMRKVGDNI